MHSFVSAGLRHSGAMTCLAAIAAGLAPGTGGAQSPQRYELVETMRIDAAAHDLSAISNIVVSARGEILVPQDQDSKVRFFDASGRPTGEYGRKGAGPGEFLGVGMSGWMGDTAWVFDYSANRTVFITPAKTHLRTVRFPSNASFPPNTPNAPEVRWTFLRAIYPGDEMLVVAQLAPNTSGEWARPAGASSAILRTTSDGTVLRRAGWMLALRSACTVSYVVPNGNGAIAVPYCANPMTIISGDGQLVVDVIGANQGGTRATYRVIARSDKGDTIFAKTLPYAPVAISRARADSVLRKWLGTNAQPAAIRAARSLTVPAFYPPIRSAMIGRDRTIWLEFHTGSNQRSWMVLDRGGTAVATFSLPDNQMPAVCDYDAKSIWVIESDEDGAESVLRLRMRPRGR